MDEYVHAFLRLHGGIVVHFGMVVVMEAGGPQMISLVHILYLKRLNVFTVWLG